MLAMVVGHRIVMSLRSLSYVNEFICQLRHPVKGKSRKESSDTHLNLQEMVIGILALLLMMGDEMDASIYRTGVAMRHTGIGRP